jgi:hypothetical protein
VECIEWNVIDEGISILSIHKSEAVELNRITNRCMQAHGEELNRNKKLKRNLTDTK